MSNDFDPAPSATTTQNDTILPLLQKYYSLEQIGA